jgi:hypothetical protein
MANYIKCPQDVLTNINNARLFLAGGISNCPDWQEDAADYLLSQLEGYDIDIINPRRNNFDFEKISTREQVTWEYNALRWSDYVLFWFPEETVCPITLLELGKEMIRRKHIPHSIFVGCHQEYKRKEDVNVQLELEIGDNIDVHYDLFSLLKHVVRRVKEDLT